MASADTSTISNNPASAQFASLYVGDLDPQVTESVLYEVFNPVGPVASIRVLRDSVSRRSLGYAYVNFHNIADAERALNTLNYSEIKGRTCRIMWSQRDPALRRSGAGNVFVKNLDKAVDNKALYDTFSLFGNILSCKVATDLEGKSRGFGFVHFENDDSAKAAIDKLNGIQLGDKVVYVGEFQKNAERNADGSVKMFTNVYVKHIPASFNEDKLKKMFAAFGSISSMVMNSDNKGRRFAFINFEDFDSAAKAVEEMHNVDVRTEEEIQAAADQPDETIEGEVPESHLYVQRAQTKIERQAYLQGKFQGRTSERPEVPGCNLYVKNLGEEVDDKALAKIFSPFGEVNSSRVMVDPGTGVSRGFGFVYFSKPEDATKAVTEMHLKLVGGKPLYVALHERKEQRLERLQNNFRQSQGGIPSGYPRANPPHFNQGNAVYGGGFPNRPGMNMGPRGMPMVGYPMPRPGMPFNAGMMAPQISGPPAFFGKDPVAGMMAPPGARAMGMPTVPRANAVGPMVRAPMPQFNPSQHLTAAALAAAPPGIQKQMLGEKLYPMVERVSPALAGKITGMMLEMDNSELLILLESEALLKTKVEEAVSVLVGK